MEPACEPLQTRVLYKFHPYNLNLEVPQENTQVPRGRSGHRIVSDDCCVYSFGGLIPVLETNDSFVLDGTEHLKLFKELWRYNIPSRRWKKLEYYSSSLPKQLVSNAVIMKESILIVHGGTGVPFGYTNNNETYIADLKCSRALKPLLTKGILPQPQYGQAMVLVGHLLYVIGGTTGYEYSSDIHCLNLKTRIWEEIYRSKGISVSEPKGRYRHEIGFYNNEIIVFGGGTTENTFGFENLHAFNIVTKQWRIISTFGDPKCSGSPFDPHFPAPRRCHGGVQTSEDNGHDSEYIISGGFDGSKIFDDIWKLNLRTLHWTKLSNLIRPLYFHAASLSPCGKMFIFGGIKSLVNHDSIITMRTNEIYSTWVKIPKLKEICWDALLYYDNTLYRQHKSLLLDKGVPIEFVQRIKS